MDFLKLLKSVEDFVYEALIWMILLPRTLLRIAWRPLRMTAYADAQLHGDDEVRFKDAISPPLLLILCVVLAHFIDLGVRNGPASEGGALERTLLGSEQNLLVYRTIAFGVWALVGAAYAVLRAGRPIDRDTLRAPFYEQCYLVAPFALAMSVAVSLSSLTDERVLAASALLAIASTLWFLVVQVAWVRRRTRLAWWASVGVAVLIVGIGSTVNFAFGYAIHHGHADAPATEHAAADESSAPGAAASR